MENIVVLNGELVLLKRDTAIKFDGDLLDVFCKDRMGVEDFDPSGPNCLIIDGHSVLMGGIIYGYTRLVTVEEYCATPETRYTGVNNELTVRLCDRHGFVQEVLAVDLLANPSDYPKMALN